MNAMLTPGVTIVRCLAFVVYGLDGRRRTTESWSSVAYVAGETLRPCPNTISGNASVPSALAGLRACGLSGCEPAIGPQS